MAKVLVLGPSSFCKLSRLWEGAADTVRKEIPDVRLVYILREAFAADPDSGRALVTQASFEDCGLLGESEGGVLWAVKRQIVILRARGMDMPHLELLGYAAMRCIAPLHPQDEVLYLCSDRACGPYPGMYFPEF